LGGNELMRDWIDPAFDLLRLEFAEGDVVSRLVSDGCQPDLAEKLVAFLPLACGRMLLKGVTFPPSYMVMSEDGSISISHTLSSDPWWRKVETFLEERKTSMMDAIGAVGRRSAEFDAVNKAVSNGSRLRDLVAAEPIFFFVKPHAEVNQSLRPWWVFWR